MKRRKFIRLLLGAAAAWPLALRAQQGGQIRRVGVLLGYPEGDPQAQANVIALRKGLKEPGWIEGQNQAERVAATEQQPIGKKVTAAVAVSGSLKADFPTFPTCSRLAQGAPGRPEIALG